MVFEKHLNADYYDYNLLGNNIEKLTLKIHNMSTI